MILSGKNVSCKHIKPLRQRKFITLMGFCLICLLCLIATLRHQNDYSVINSSSSETRDFISFLKDQQHKNKCLCDKGSPVKRKPLGRQRVQREYINPVQAILQQREWKGAYLKELYLNRTINTTIAQTPMRVEFPETINQINLPKSFQKYPNVNCAKLFDADPRHLIEVEKLMIKKKDPSPFVKQEVLMESMKNCTKFVKNNEYVLSNVSKSEQNFPIAYSIIIYKDISQVEHLLRAIYRPQNLYCIHVDPKSEKSFKEAAQQLAACFDNVFISSRSTSVFWGHYSVLEADLICLEDLWRKRQKSKRKWKYFINLTGQEFPLKTNWEIVQILKANEGAVWVGATVSNMWAERWQSTHSFKTKAQPGKPYITRGRPKGTPPHPYRFAKGAVHVALPDYFVDFALHDKIATDLRKWIQDIKFPDETFFPTLVSSKHLGVPGAYTGTYNSGVDTGNPLVRFKKWYSHRPCRGKDQRQICILGIWDLPELKLRPELFANKFESNYHPVAFLCLEELHWNKTREEMFLFGQKLEPHFDTSPYQYLPWIRHYQRKNLSQTFLNRHPFTVSRSESEGGVMDVTI